MSNRKAFLESLSWSSVLEGAEVDASAAVGIGNFVLDRAAMVRKRLERRRKTRSSTAASQRRSAAPVAGPSKALDVNLSNEFDLI